MLCECGCGQTTKVARQTKPEWGHVAGEPFRFILGHATRLKPKRTLADRFWEKVNKTDSCWLWTASLNSKGYGQILGNTYYAKPLIASRVSWELHNGPIPGKAEVCHNCPGGDNPLCVNPDHLFLGSHKDNHQDRMKKNHAAATHCPKGHPYDEANTYVRATGQRRCRTCHRETERIAHRS